MTSVAEQSPPYIRGISPYVPGKPITQVARELGLAVENIVKLASNENPLGMSGKARAAIASALKGAERYPDQFNLIAALAERHGVEAAQVILGNGSNDVLDLVARAFLAPGRSAVCSQYAFAVYPLATIAAGAACIAAPAKDFGHDPVAMSAAIQADTPVLWIANPNNPTGNFIRKDDLRRFIASIPPRVVVVLDEAYTDYLSPVERFDATSWIGEFPNLIITRTFSKIYGLAGLRIGYGIAAPEVADLMNRVRQPFNVNSLALAGALAALADQEFVAVSYELNRRGMEQLISGVDALGVQYIPSHGNFLTLSVPLAAKVNLRLLEQGVIVRPLVGYGLPGHLRVTIGLEHENVRFLAAFERALKT